MATPAQVANDMAAQAAYWTGRDREVARTCLDAARVIRELLATKPVDGRTLHGLNRRLLTLEGNANASQNDRLYASLSRARAVIGELAGWGLKQ